MKIIFLDRDGVINKYPGDYKYVTSWEEFQFLPGVKEAIKKLNDCGFSIFVVSNQAGVSKGIYPQQELDKITKNMLDELKASGASINEVFYCTHTEKDNCSCRKPKTGLIEIAIKKLREQNKIIDLTNSYFIGDTLRDIQTGKSAGLKTILVFSGKEKPDTAINLETPPDLKVSGLKEAADYICSK